MSSTLSDYSYDIFISYRHNDNKFDGWVTEFVNNLSRELQATLKDPVRIYFDENASDGIKESHLVEESLSNKTKSIIFIPIISQTYCDTESFAWKQELIPFKNAATGDHLGQNIELRNGNVVSRILPIKIHDLEQEDIRLLESELSGYLRSIDFIYSDKGVNRPLREQDDMLLSGNYHILYRNQINLVANAVKDIMLGIKHGATQVAREAPILKERKISVQDIPGIDELHEERKKVYLAWTSNDLKEKRQELAIILDKAGFDVVPSLDCPTDDDNFKEVVADQISKADMSLHICSGEYGRRFEQEDEISFPRFQFEQARGKSHEDQSEFKVFVWYLPNFSGAVKQSQQSFINEMRQNISEGMTFSNSPNSNQLIDDIRASTTTKEEPVMDAKDTDVFFIYNENDEFEANEITDSLSSNFPLEILNILADGDEEYQALSKQQIMKSKLAVIYFKYTADWAVPFAKQVWKEIGGANSPTPLMLIGEDDPKSNLSRKFKAPKVVCSIVPKSNLTDEVLKVYGQLST